MMSLPKLIHLIWIGDDAKRPHECMNSWKEKNKDYSVMIWGNREVRSVKWSLASMINLWFNREINGAADIIRWLILHQYGGIALDADGICIKPLEDWLLNVDCFAAWENEIARPGLIATGALGFPPQHPLVSQILRDIANDPDPYNGRAWQKLGPQRITDTVQELKYINITIYPSHYFYPRHFTGLQYTGSGHVFARQHWGSTL